MRHRRTKACSIKKGVKEKVWRRDNGKCVLCDRVVPLECACAHYISRAQGGLGIEQNILTLCADCHREYDEGPDRKRLKKQFGAYLNECYEDWDEDDLVYHKWGIRE